MRIGLCADTHGLVRPALLRALAGCDLILHAGDVGGDQVAEALAALAPLLLVRGNNDPARDDWPTHRDLDLAGCRVHLVHDRQDARPGAARIVVFGHSHRPSVEERDGRLWVNPGSAGPRRFRLPVEAAILRLDAGEPSVAAVDLLA